MPDRIAEVRIEGLRTIEKLQLRLDGLIVLIGENGSGKSSIIEACEILRAAARPEFSRAFHGVHGGAFNLLRWGATHLTLGARIEGDPGQPSLEYEIVMLERNGSVFIHGESLRSEGAILVERLEDRTRVSKGAVLSDIVRLRHNADGTLAALGSIDVDPGILRARAALEQIEVHVAFDTMPAWALRATGRQSGLRASVPIQQTDRLELLGKNLANAYFALAHDYDTQHWHETLDYVRLGLGQEVQGVATIIDPAGGAIGLALELRGARARVPASVLSDGQVAYLAFVALLRLKSPRSLLAFDEPEPHLHPGLLARVVQLFEACSESYPVLLTTHSDGIADAVSDPVNAVRVCELERPEGRTVVRSLDATALGKWLQDYRGVGHLRSDGFLSQVLDEQR